jgi:hypothetical protein
MDSFIVHPYVMLQAQLMFVLMMVALLGTIYDYTRWALTEKHRVRVVISEESVSVRDRTPLLLFARNTTAKEVRLVNAGVRLPNGSAVQLSIPGMSFPFTLGGLGRCTSAIDSPYLQQAVRHRGYDRKVKLIGYVTDDAGTIYRSKPFIYWAKVPSQEPATA